MRGAYASLGHPPLPAQQNAPPKPGSTSSSSDSDESVYNSARASATSSLEATIQGLTIQDPTTIQDLAIQDPTTNQEPIAVQSENQSQFLSASSVPYPTWLSASNMWSKYIVAELPNVVPEVYIGVHPLEGPSTLRHRVHRVVAPCHAPSIMDGNELSFHMTSHVGYSFKQPSDTEHNNKDRIKSVGNFITRGTKVGGFITKLTPGSPSIPVDGVVSGVSSFSRTVGNRSRLMNVGIDPDERYTLQRAEYSETDTIEEIIRDAATEAGRPFDIKAGLYCLQLDAGRIVGVCHDCLKCLRQGKDLRQGHLTLDQYRSLTQKETELEVTLTNLPSVTIFARTLRCFKKVQRLVLRIDSGCFEAPMGDERRNTFKNGFDELGTAIRRQGSLTYLKILGTYLESDIYGGLKSALRSHSLETICITGLLGFFEDRSIDMSRRYIRNLKQLELDNVRVNTTMASNNLRYLINKRKLEVLVATQAGITSEMAALIFMDEKKVLRTPFTKFKRLVLSDNNLAIDDVANILEHVVFASKNTELDLLDVTGNPRIGQDDHRKMLKMMRANNCKAELKTERRN
ncbi:hypothetical protein B0O80DRAFT_526298 [Mortierella sp. GBAus27b]|nr:hypothetical protein BGX31_004253 [Mortierella sp. GBA43]KAI8359637.1 hypothetical protein B0O80DRAFT_526298 [Mortierella sp. GBAus27b]